MKSKIAQFNVRVPREIAHAMKVVASMLDVPVQQLGADAIAIYYGQADEAAIERQKLALEAARRLFPQSGFAVKEDKLAEQPSVKEPRLPLRQSPKRSQMSQPEALVATIKKQAKEQHSDADFSTNAKLVPLPGLSFFREATQTIPAAA